MSLQEFKKILLEINNKLDELNSFKNSSNLLKFYTNKIWDEVSKDGIDPELEFKIKTICYEMANEGATWENIFDN